MKWMTVGIAFMGGCLLAAAALTGDLDASGPSVCHLVHSTVADGWCQSGIGIAWRLW